MWLLHNMIRQCLTLKKPLNCLPKEPYHFASPPTRNESFGCSTDWPLGHIVSFLDFSYFIMYKMALKCNLICNCCFNLKLPNDVLFWASFHMIVCHFCIFFSKTSVWIFIPLFKSYGWVLRVLNNFRWKLFIRYVFCKYVLLYEGCLFIFLIMSCRVVLF